ncbi:TetR/AcrR family transcriptional regulator C-terminal domain-containing protein [Variovorax sp. MHTC-1]|uniref:TetR/AcrR family transcriptional regulator C-terminal domain-containing protein n=1 Tax=Variovorax sp. MHTC-1 TaxID=2495593 RepID=UPI000F87E185|nr:TetR/AcrR family transcriptional regulator C-terminal domain-containing protein [Variovorax sp. MHTC-1]RST48898.1 TetR family transcriptional regulator [Variovorax sp. MHTC-1]
MLKLLSRVKSLASNRDNVPRGTTDGRSHIDGVPDELAIEIDADGSPITVHEADWFVCFVPGLQRQWWHRFANAKHKHVFALRLVDDDTWLLVEPWWTRLMVSVLTLDEAIKFLRWGAAGNILKVREAIPGRGSQARGWSNCAVLMSFLLGRSYWTWTPNGLYRRLIADAHAEPVELTQFLSEHFRSVANRNADQALKSLPSRTEEPLDEVLRGLGTSVMRAMMSPSAISLYKAAVSDRSRFKDAAAAYWTFGPKRAVDRICEVLEDAQRRGEVKVDDCALAARQFVAMLRGNLLLEIVFGLRASPNPVEIHVHVMSVVAMFLRGACPVGRARMRSTSASHTSGSSPGSDSAPEQTFTCEQERSRHDGLAIERDEEPRKAVSLRATLRKYLFIPAQIILRCQAQAY